MTPRRSCSRDRAVAAGYVSCTLSKTTVNNCQLSLFEPLYTTRHVPTSRQLVGSWSPPPTLPQAASTGRGTGVKAQGTVQLL
jgi:hypothetical protein